MRTAVALRLLPVAALLSLASIATRAAAAEAPSAQVRHELEVRIDPAASTIEATDRLTFPLGIDRLAKTPAGGLRIQMHAALELEAADAAWAVKPLAEEKAPGGEEAAPEDLKLRAWELRPAARRLAEGRRAAPSLQGARSSTPPSPRPRTTAATSRARPARSAPRAWS